MESFGVKISIYFLELCWFFFVPGANERPKIVLATCVCIYIYIYLSSFEISSLLVVDILESNLRCLINYKCIHECTLNNLRTIFKNIYLLVNSCSTCQQTSLSFLFLLTLLLLSFWHLNNYFKPKNNV